MRTPPLPRRRGRGSRRRRRAGNASWDAAGRRRGRAGRSPDRSPRRAAPISRKSRSAWPMLAAEKWRPRTGATKTSAFLVQCRSRSAFAQTRGPARRLAKAASTGLPAGRQRLEPRHRPDQDHAARPARRSAGRRRCRRHRRSGRRTPRGSPSPSRLPLRLVTPSEPRATTSKRPRCSATASAMDWSAAVNRPILRPACLFRREVIEQRPGCRAAAMGRRRRAPKTPRA